MLSVDVTPPDADLGSAPIGYAGPTNEILGTGRFTHTCTTPLTDAPDPAEERP